MDPLADITKRLEIARQRNQELRRELEKLIAEKAERLENVFEE